MRRISNKQFTYKYFRAFVIPVILFALAVVVLLSPVLFPEAPYEYHNEKEVTVSHMKTIYRYRAPDLHRMYTDDGEVYTLTGEYIISDVEKYLVSGAKVRILWCENRFSFMPNLAEEVIVDGVTVVTYDNDKPIAWAPLIVLAVILVMIAVAYMLFSLFNIKHLKNLQNNRDKRIENKYGANAVKK